MNIVDWFGPYNLEHIKAYKHLMDKGVWPEGFIPDGLEFGYLWQTRLWNKMAMCWVDYILTVNS